MKQTEIEETLKQLSPTTIKLLRMLREHVSLEDWKARQTVQANRMGLLKLRNKKLLLTSKGERIADRL